MKNLLIPNFIFSDFLADIFPKIDPLVEPNSLDLIISLLTVSKPDTLSQQLSLAIKSKLYTKGFLESRQDLITYYQSISNESDIFRVIVEGFFANLTQASLEPVLNMAWFSKLPCFEVPGLTGNFEGENTFLKYCTWKGNQSLRRQSIAPLVA